MPVGPVAGPPQRSPYSLFRLDDRLLHGQVALAWGPRLRARHFLLADERLAADPASTELYAAAAPEGSDVGIVAPEELLRGGQSLPDPARTILLVRGVSEAARLLRGGVPGPLNLGGLHAHTGARQVLPYLFLNAQEETVLAELLREGFFLFAQDLPQSPRRDARDWCRGDPGGASAAEGVMPPREVHRSEPGDLSR